MNNVRSIIPGTIHPFFWLVIPVAMIVGQIGLELFAAPETLAPMHTEGGLHEILQSVYLGLALVLAMIGMARVDWANQKPLGLWFALATFCTFYVFGEEISWGQHILNWDTPEYWARVNDQNETNLHNTSAWLDQKPRLILFIGIVCAGLIVPALRRWKREWLPARFSRIYPTNIVIVTSLGVLLPYLAQEIAEHFFDRDLFLRVSEVQELYMYYFVFLYVWDLQNQNFSQEKP